MKNIRRLLVMLIICGIAHSEVKMEIPDLLSTASSVSIFLDDDPKKEIVIFEKGVWKNKDLVKARSMHITAIGFRFSGGLIPHLVQAYKGNVILMHEQGDKNYYKSLIRRISGRFSSLTCVCNGSLDDNEAKPQALQKVVHNKLLREWD